MSLFLFFFFFFFNDPATTESYTLSLHDALPIWPVVRPARVAVRGIGRRVGGERRRDVHGRRADDEGRGRLALRGEAQDPSHDPEEDKGHQARRRSHDGAVATTDRG